MPTHPAGRRRRRRAEVRTALRRMSAITVFVAALALTSPPAAAPTDREAPAAGPLMDAMDPLVGPWQVDRFLTPYPDTLDSPAAQHARTASTPAAVLRAAGVMLRRAGVAASTLGEFLRHGSAVVRLGLRWLHDVPWPGDIRQTPLPAPSWDFEDLPVLTPDGFGDILNYGGTGTLRSGVQLPVAGRTPRK